MASAAPGLPTISTGTTSPGATVKWKTSSWGRASARARTEIAIAVSSSVNGAKVSVATLFASIVTGSDSNSCPLSSTATRQSSTRSLPRFASLAVTAARSRPEKKSRCTEAPATLIFGVWSSSATDTGVSTVPGGSSVFAALSTPTRWKSLMRIASSSGSSESSRIPCASCNAGP